MRISEIILEADDNENDPSSKIIPILNLLIGQADGNETGITLPIPSLLQLIKNAGVVGFNYQALTDAAESNPAIKNMISNMDNTKITLKTNTSSDSPEFDAEPGANGNAENEFEQSPEDVVNSMANNRLSPEMKPPR